MLEGVMFAPRPDLGAKQNNELRNPEVYWMGKDIWAGLVWHSDVDLDRSKRRLPNCGTSSTRRNGVVTSAENTS